VRPWQAFALAAVALGALWLFTRSRSKAPAAAPAAATPAPQTPTIGTVADQLAKLPSATTNVVNIDAVPSTLAVGWLGQPAIVPTPAGTAPTSPAPASAPDPTPSGWGSGGIQIGPSGRHLF